DAYHGKLRDENGKIAEVSIYVALGIDMEGYKQILGYWIKQGKENKNFWIEIFQDMISRGMSKVGIFVTDDFSGLTKVIEKFFPQSDHQLCWVHMKRNLRREFSGD
ncbi:MAG TPA: IS256 family transposase, partial [Thermotogae bacterium]|nr:IS256 family transposase [Thermotogota bacterium]